MFICLQDFAAYLAFCGIVLHNAQLYEMSLLENRRNQVRPTGLSQECRNQEGLQVISASSSCFCCGSYSLGQLLLIPMTECCVSVIKLSRAALGRGWAHSSLGCEKWPVQGEAGKAISQKIHSMLIYLILPEVILWFTICIKQPEVSHSRNYTQDYPYGIAEVVQAVLFSYYHGNSHQPYFQ